MLETTLPSALPDDSAGSILDRIWQREPCDQHVAVAHGYNVQLRVCGGQLVIRDGMGRHQRERKYPKADRTLRRVVITGTTGYVTLEAYRWCTDHGITVASVSPDAELTSHYASADVPADPGMIRAQVLASTDDRGTEVARELVARKLEGQADNLVRLLGAYASADSINRAIKTLADVATIEEMRQLEGKAAQDYFRAWSDVSVPWSDRDSARVPVNWLVYPGRISKVAVNDRKSKRNASDPVNAMLNYGYAIGYSEAKAACLTHGLEASIGFLHADKIGRDSLALDVLEAIRPEIDAYVLRIMGYGQDARKFSYRDFAEPYNCPPGTVRVVAPLTHEIAEQAMHWQVIAVNAAHECVRILKGKIAATRTSGNDGILTNDEWKRISALVPVASHGSNTSNRVIVGAMVHAQRQGITWAHVPADIGVSYQTMLNRRRAWTRSGHWSRIETVIAELSV